MQCVEAYYNEYAARISTGAWKAKKHKRVAAEARQAWKELKRSNGGQVWMQHSKETRSKDLAKRGQRGEKIERTPALVVD